MNRGAEYLFDDEEREVSSSSICALSDLIIDVYSKDQDLKNHEKILSCFKMLLQNPKLIGKEDLNRLIVEKAP